MRITERTVGRVCIYMVSGLIIIIIIIFIYTAQIQRTFSNAPYNSKSFTVLKSNLQLFHQIKSNQMLVFEGRGKPEYPEKTSWSRVENQQTQPTYDAESGNRTRDTLVEGERSHHCVNPAPQCYGLWRTPFNCSVFTFTDEANSTEAEVGVEMSHLNVYSEFFCTTSHFSTIHSHLLSAYSHLQADEHP